MKALALALLAIAITPARAQFGNAGAPPTMSGWGRSPGSFSQGIPSGHPFPGSRSNVIFLGEPWLANYPLQSGQPTYIVLQPQASPAAKPAEEPKPITPLLIEWQGDRFVRMTSTEPWLRNGSSTPQAEVHQPLPDHPPAKSKDNPLTANATKDAPVTLIYRDGHREQVHDYSIIGERLYTSADYVQSGSWMKTISLSILNLPATIEANQEAGVPFALPTAANVVVTRF
jgi:hypothetical protein